jgi:hypothetical protein
MPVKRVAKNGGREGPAIKRSRDNGKGTETHIGEWTTAKVPYT